MTAGTVDGHMERSAAQRLGYVPKQHLDEALASAATAFETARKAQDLFDRLKAENVALKTKLEAEVKRRKLSERSAAWLGARARQWVARKRRAMLSAAAAESTSIGAASDAPASISRVAEPAAPSSQARRSGVRSWPSSALRSALCAMRTLTHSPASSSQARCSGVWSPCAAQGEEPRRVGVWACGRNRGWRTPPTAWTSAPSLISCSRLGALLPRITDHRPAVPLAPFAAMEPAERVVGGPIEMSTTKVGE